MLAAPWYVRDIVSRHKPALTIPPGPPGAHRSVPSQTHAHTSRGKQTAALQKGGMAAWLRASAAGGSKRGGHCWRRQQMLLVALQHRPQPPLVSCRASLRRCFGGKDRLGDILRATLSGMLLATCKCNRQRRRRQQQHRRLLLPNSHGCTMPQQALHAHRDPRHLAPRAVRPKPCILTHMRVHAHMEQHGRTRSSCASPATSSTTTTRYSSRGPAPSQPSLSASSNGHTHGSLATQLCCCMLLLLLLLLLYATASLPYTSGQAHTALLGAVVGNESPALASRLLKAWPCG